MPDRIGEDRECWACQEKGAVYAYPLPIKNYDMWGGDYLCRQCYEDGYIDMEIIMRRHEEKVNGPHQPE